MAEGMHWLAIVNGGVHVLPGLVLVLGDPWLFEPRIERMLRQQAPHIGPFGLLVVDE